MLGMVDWFDVKRGYGFIMADDGNDYFVHYSNIKGDGFRKLKEFDEVEFEPSKNEKGFIALNVEKQEVEYKIEDDPNYQLVTKIYDEFGVKIPMIEWIWMEEEELEQYYDELKKNKITDFSD